MDASTTVEADETLRLVRLSERDRAERSELLDRYEREVYAPSFPDPELREDPSVWRRLLDRDPGPPQPRIDIILALTGAGEIVGGATIEHYRGADCGLLTYIAVAEGRRDGGIGRSLIGHARERLTEWAGPDVPMFAETEIYDEAESDRERGEIALRQKRLDRLGAKVLDFNYMMPPLRAGLPPRRLHLMVIGDSGRTPSAVDSGRVVRLVEELASALGADLAAHAETSAMVEQLRGAGTIALRPLPASRFDRRFVETPAFAGLGSASFSFAFAVRFDSSDSDRAMLRLERIETAIEGDAAAHKALIGPTRSFLDDVTTGPPGCNGRPLVFAASGADAEAAERRVAMQRPACWRYEFEGETTELVSARSDRPIELRLQDGFCAFESGRLFYLLTLTPASGETGLDEYALLQIEQFALEPDRYAEDESFLRFDWSFGAEPAHGSLLALAEARLKALEASAIPTDAFEAIIDRYEIRPKGKRREALAASDLNSLCIAVESAEMLAAAKEAEAIGEKPVPPEAPVQIGTGLPAHRDPDNPLPGRLLALAGLAQGVPDFPFQDQSELFDSTRPVCTSHDYSLFVHPRFMIEVGTDWRSLEEGRRCIGSCPYLLLMWAVALHDELIVTDLETEIDRMIFDTGGSDYRAVPLGELARGLKAAGSVGDRGIEAIRNNLERRLEMFRWLSINRVGNLFRYHREKTALAEIQAAMGTSDRFERAHIAVDRIEALVEDVSNLQSSYAERGTNRILFAIALLSVLSVSSDLSGLVDERLRPWVFVVLVAFALAALAAVYWRSRRIRKAGPGTSPSRTP